MREDSAKEEIRRRIDTVAYISRYVPLQRSGSRFRGRCPFHEERHPSFYVDPASGMFKCFGCGAAGDIFTFVQRIQNCTFPEAVEQLAAEVGVEWRPRGRDEGARSLRQAVFRANEMALKFFVEQLAGPAGKAAQDYLYRRGLNADTIARFDLGYAPADGQALQRYLASRGLTRELMTKAGLVKASGQDMFTDRVMFAVRDVTGRILGFGGRALSDDEPAKYINSPDTPVFKKGETLYALHLARKAAGEAGRVVIVEGYTDVIAAHQAGVEYVVACLGTALTPDHLRLAARYAEEIVLAYDADAAGFKAALRDIGMFERCPAEVRIALLPEGHDPDTLIRSQGPEAFERVLAAAVPAAEFRLRQTLAQYEGSEETPAALAAAAEILADVPDRTRRVELLDRVADWCGRGDATRTDMLRRALWLEVGRKISARRSAAGEGRRGRARGTDDQDVIVQTVAQCAGDISPGRVRLEKSLLAWAVSEADLATRIFRDLGPECFCAPGHGPIAQALAEQVRSGEFKPDELVGQVSGDVAQALLAELLLQDMPKPEMEELTAAVQKLRMLHTVGVQALPWEDALDEMSDEAEEPGGPVAELEKLRREVVARLDRGEISPEDPLYQRYLRLAERVHGRGGVSFYEEHR